MRGWSEFDPETERQIRPLTEWAEFMSGPFVRNRLDSTYIDKLDAYVAEFGREAAARLGWA